jgi:hypothetical protein
LARTVLTFRDMTASISRFTLSTVRTSGRPPCPDGLLVRMLGKPTMGESMTLFGRDGTRIVTTNVTGMFHDQSGEGMYVQTRNSLYYLEEAKPRLRAPDRAPVDRTDRLPAVPLPGGDGERLAG